MKRSISFQEKYQYTDYQMKLLQWIWFTFISEFSKAVILSFYFLYCKQLNLFFWSVLLFWVLRYNSGGLHFRTYLGCLGFTGIYMIAAIQWFPMLRLSKNMCVILLLFCICILHKIGPIPSKYRPLPENILSCYKVNLLQILLLYDVLMFLLPENKYLQIGFWIVVVHTLQMGIAYKKKGVR